MRWWALGVVVASAGCVPAASMVPGDLVLAQRALGRAADSAFADRAAEEIAEAEVALDLAEREQAMRPGSARAAEDAYVARRAAEKAWVAGRCAAAREALLRARRAASHLAADLARREAFFASLSRRRAALAEARAEQRRALLSSVVGARAAGARILERADAIVVRFSVEQIFLHGTSLLRDGAEERLDRLAACLAKAPPSELQLAIVDDVEGFRTRPRALASRRHERLREALSARGVPASAFRPRAVHPPSQTQIDVLVIAPELPLPPDDADGAGRNE